MTPDDKATIIEHLEELRKSLLVSIVAIILGAVVAFYFSDIILAMIQRPVKMLDLNLVFIGITEGFYIKMKLALWGGFVLAFPVVAWQIYRFVSPALFANEKKYVLILVPIMVVLFALGVVFAYVVVLPVAIAVLVLLAGDLEPMLTAEKYVSFFLTFTIPFGLVFELPVIVYFLTRLGVIDARWLAAKRKYALLAIFVAAAVLTPGPDPLSQVLMGVPIYVLYEISILVSKIFSRKKASDNSEEDLDNVEESIEDNNN